MSTMTIPDYIQLRKSCLEAASKFPASSVDELMNTASRLTQFVLSGAMPYMAPNSDNNKSQTMTNLPENRVNGPAHRENREEIKGEVGLEIVHY